MIDIYVNSINKASHTLCDCLIISVYIDVIADISPSSSPSHFVVFLTAFLSFKVNIKFPKMNL